MRDLPGMVTLFPGDVIGEYVVMSFLLICKVHSISYDGDLAQ